MGYDRINDFSLDRLALILDSGDEIDLNTPGNSMFASISFFQDMFTGVLHCELILSDANDLYSLLPFKNNEILDVAFSSPQNDSVKLKLRMYGREEKSIKDSGRTSQYKLKFVSPETFLNSGIKFSRSYTGKISSMVGAIWTENFKDVRGPESSNKIKVEETSDEYSLVLPFESPFTHIHNFTKKAKSGSSSESCSYFFYEDFKGFNFVSLESIFQQNPRAYFSYELRESALEKEKPIGTDTLGSRFRIRDLTFSGKENILDEIKNGLYSGVINIHDVMNKKISSSVFKIPSLPFEIRT